MPKLLSVDEDAYNLVADERKAMRERGIEGASFADAIRSLHGRAQLCLPSKN